MADQEEKLVLKSEVIKKYLTNLDWTDDRQSLQCDTMIIESRKIENLGKDFPEVAFLRKLNLTNNNISDISALAQFKNLVCLQMSENKIKTLAVFCEEENFPSLRRLEIAKNKITELMPIQCPKLEYLDASGQKIEKHEAWTGHANLKVLKLSENKLKTMGFCTNLPALESLDLANNAIAALGGYEGLDALKSLNLEGTKIDKIEEECPPLPALESINLSSTRISNIENLKNIFQFEQLSSLNIEDTPVENNASSFNMFLAELLNLSPKLATYCEKDVTDQNKYEAVYLAKYRFEKKEEERKRKEEE